jgi:enoyl-CoA hydratase/carnithine racemase
MFKKEIVGDLAIIKLNRPEQANALNRELFLGLTEELEAIKRGDDIRVVIFTGEGEKAFCAGIDLKERAQKSNEEIFLERKEVIRPFYLELGDFPKPTIAALNGLTLGGGAELALACDIRIASNSAKFGQTEIKWGMIPSCGACQRLRLITGVSVAKEIVFTGRVLEAKEAYRLGIYSYLVSDEYLMVKSIELAKEIAANSPVAVKQAKKILDIGSDISRSLDFEFEASTECFVVGDAFSKSKSF